MIGAGDMNVRRTMTATPLARMHDRMLLGQGVRRHKPVLFQRFDRAKYPRAALTLALDAQTALARGEYGAVDLFARIASELARHGAPFDVISAAARIPSDEIRHADLTLRMACALAGQPVELGAVRTQDRRGAIPDPVALDIVMTAIPAALDARLAHGAFRASPVVVDYLRCDVVAHAQLALKPSA